MNARVIVTTTREYQTAISKHGAGEPRQAPSSTACCATCHGMTGEGAYGPNLSNNPLLTQTAGLLSIVQNGRGKCRPSATRGRRSSSTRSPPM